MLSLLCQDLQKGGFLEMMSADAPCYRPLLAVRHCAWAPALWLPALCLPPAGASAVRPLAEPLASRAVKSCCLFMLLAVFLQLQEDCSLVWQLAKTAVLPVRGSRFPLFFSLSSAPHDQGQQHGQLSPVISCGSHGSCRSSSTYWA